MAFTPECAAYTGFLPTRQRNPGLKGGERRLAAAVWRGRRCPWRCGALGVAGELEAVAGVVEFGEAGFEVRPELGIAE